jgi:hypothetical protein
MYSSLTEMLASSHRDQLRRQASAYRLGRQARQSSRVINTRRVHFGTRSRPGRCQSEVSLRSGPPCTLGP